MPTHSWPTDADFQRMVLTPSPTCPLCWGGMRICDHRHRDLQVFGGRLHLVCRLAQCKDPQCPMHTRTLSPEAEMSIAPPRLIIGWEPFAWIGHRRLARDWRVSQIREELHDNHRVDLSEDSIERYISRYQTMLAAREQDPRTLAEVYRDSVGVILSIDGLQPEKGHETLYVVRELTQKRIWFAVPLLSSAAPEVACLLVQAQQWAHCLGKPVLAWVSDKQEAFVSGIATLFPGVPHRYCANHFLRDAAKPMLELDSHAKVQMRRKVRGLREIERSTLEVLHTQEACEPPVTEPSESLLPRDMPSPTPEHPAEGSVVLDYCAAVRGILNDDQGGPISPPGVRMADALKEVHASLGRVLELPKPGLEHDSLERLAACLDRGLKHAEADLAKVRDHSRLVAYIDSFLDPANGSAETRRASFESLADTLRNDADPIHSHMGRVMTSFAPGLFAGGDTPGLPIDNLDLERAFKHPKRHQRRIHGRAHSGSKLVQVGPTLLLALDAHLRHPDLFTTEELTPYCLAQPPPCQQDALRRRTLMRKARSSKQRSALLASLEARYLNAG